MLIITGNNGLSLDFVRTFDFGGVTENSDPAGIFLSFFAGIGKRDTS